MTRELERTGAGSPPRGGPAGRAGVYLEGDLCQAPRALDVEAEDGQAQVGLVLHRLLARVELLALVDVLSARLTPAGQDRGTQATPAPWFLLAFWQVAAGIPPGTGSSLPPEAACLRVPQPSTLFLVCAWPLAPESPAGEAPRRPRPAETCLSHTRNGLAGARWVSCSPQRPPFCQGPGTQQVPKRIAEF